MRTILLVQIATTLAMTGLIWFVQVVHYPLFERIPPGQFARYEAGHATRTGWVVAPLMLAELATTLLLLVPRYRPPAVPAWSAWSAAALLAAIWLSTAFVQVPLHNKLAGGYNQQAIAMLVATNWLRTLAWTARSVLVLGWIARLPGA